MNERTCVCSEPSLVVGISQRRWQWAYGAMLCPLISLGFPQVPKRGQDRVSSQNNHHPSWKTCAYGLCLQWHINFPWTLMLPLSTLQEKGRRWQNFHKLCLRNCILDLGLECRTENKIGCRDGQTEIAGLDRRNISKMTRLYFLPRAELDTVNQKSGWVREKKIRQYF